MSNFGINKQCISELTINYDLLIIPQASLAGKIKGKNIQ
jgi:hypothetical protein